MEFKVGDIIAVEFARSFTYKVVAVHTNGDITTTTLRNTGAMRHSTKGFVIVKQKPKYKRNLPDWW